MAVQVIINDESLVPYTWGKIKECLESKNVTLQDDDIIKIQHCETLCEPPHDWLKIERNVEDKESKK